jgi:hypothetical protein
MYLETGKRTPNMSASAAQIQANRQNAQLSTGATTPEGKKRSSLNATRHGFTGQSLVLADEEKDAYETHSIAFMESYQPATHEETSLVQQYADLTWSLHQIAIQQSNVMSLINAITRKLVKDGDYDALAAAVAPHYKTINTLSLYETRRRRAAEATLARFNELAAARKQQFAQAVQLYKAAKAQDKPFNPSEFGFVCSLPEIERFVLRQTALADAQKFLSVAKTAA